MNYDPNTGQPINNNYQQQPVQKEDSNGIAIAGFFVSMFFSAIIGIIISIVGLKKAKKLNGAGKGWAIGGIVAGVAKIIIAVAVILFNFALFEAIMPGFWSDFGDLVKDPTKYCSQATYCGPEIGGYKNCKSITESGMTVEMTCPVDKIVMVDDKTKTTTTNKTTTTTKIATTPTTTGNFLLPIEDVFTISGRGTVVTCKITRGTIKLNDEVQIVGLSKEIITTKVIGIEMFHKTLDEATEGDNVGLLLEGVTREQVERGQVVITPNTMKEYTKFDAEIYVLTKEEGGRHTPFFTNYRPQFYFRTTDVTGTITLKDTEMVNPGDTINVSAELLSSIALEEGTEFSIREGGRTVGKGKVTKLYE